MGNTFSRRSESALMSKGFSTVYMWVTVFPLRKMRCIILPSSSFASDRHRLKLSGLMPMSVPVNFWALAVVTMTCLSASAAISVKYFLCATDNSGPPFLLIESAKQLFKISRIAGASISRF